MTFKIRKLGHRRWPVVVKLAECDASGVVVEAEQKFIGLFKAFTEADVEAARTAVYGDIANDEQFAKDAMARSMGEQAALDAKFYGHLLIGWEDLSDESGQALPYSQEALTAVCTGPDGMAVRRGLGQSVVEIRFGIAPAKNAVTSPAPGPASGPSEAEKTS